MRTRGAPSARTTAAPRPLGGGHRTWPLPPGQRPRDEGRQGECWRCILPRTTAAPRMLGEDRRQRPPPGGWPRDEVRREEDRRRTLPPDDSRAANIWGRVAGGIPLTEDGHATRFGGRRTGGASSPGRTPHRKYWGGGSPAMSPSLTKATIRGSVGGGRSARGASSPRRTDTP